MISGFVMIIMLLVEYITLQGKGELGKKLKNNTKLQILTAAVLGAIPGCFGTFAVVSLYVRKVVGAAAVVAAMIATSGDEAFIMLSLIPKEAAVIMATTFITAVIAGYLVHIITSKKNITNKKEKEITTDENKITILKTTNYNTIKTQLKHISLQKILILFGIILFSISVLAGGLEHKHLHIENNSPQTTKQIHNTEHKTEYEQAERYNWENYFFILISISGFIIVLISSEHFIKKHIWKHIIKKHFLKIFLWTLLAIYIIHNISDMLNVKQWIENNYITMLLIAVIVGIIPESGPHIVFISLYVSGSIPLSILIANSIVQDGHGSIPLLAESPKSFSLIKGINILAGLIAGALIHFF